MLRELLQLLPEPSRQVLPARDSVRIGRHVREGRDIYYSFQHGFDPTAPPPPHALTLILGEMGSGKTSLMRLILLQRLLQGRTIVTLDPEGENNRLCEAMGGRVVPAGMPDAPDVCLLHPLEAGDAAEMLMAAKFLLSTLSDRTKLSAGEQAALHEAVKRRWARRPGQMRVVDLVDALGTVNMSEAVNLMAYLRPFAAGGLWEGFFDRPTALIVPDLPAGSWVNYDLSALREESKAIVYAVLAWFLYHTVTLRPKIDASRATDSPAEGMDVFIDEGWRLLRQGMFADLLDELGRRARKRGVGVVLTTHLPGDLSKNNRSLSFAANAFLGRMGPDEGTSFFRSLGISEAAARKNAESVAKLPPRTFLAAPSGGRGGVFPVHVQIPKIWLDMWARLGARN
jgi:type IV secretory pathway VirB4 component